LQLTDPVTTTGTNTDQYAPWISFSGHAFDVTDHTVDWQIGEASTNTDDGTGKPLHYLFFQIKRTVADSEVTTSPSIQMEI
jgi:hypothetical protein